MGNIIRVFRAVARPGKADEFRRFFLDQAVDIVRQHQGLVSVEVGTPTERTPNEFLMITTWSSLEALVGFTGPDWKEAVIAPQEAPLLAEVSVHHYYSALRK